MTHRLWGSGAERLKKKTQALASGSYFCFENYAIKSETKIMFVMCYNLRQLLDSCIIACCSVGDADLNYRNFTLFT